MRKLTSIQKVEEVFPILGADTIEHIRTQGWHVVVKKEQFKVNDLCVYFEIDSLLPNIPQFAFLEKGQKLKKSIIENGVEVEGWRLKTISLQGQISQGLALPLNDFPDILNPIEGMDVTSLIGVNKYEPPLPACLSGEAKGSFPGFLSKTDEDRIQILLHMLDQYRGQRFYLTTKLDGSSCTCFKHENEFNVCGRTLNFRESDTNLMWRIANRYNLKERFPNGYSIQSECAGEGIQKNRHKLKGQDLYIFYVVNINTGEYLKLDDMKAFVKEIGMKTVPIFNENFILDHTLEQILDMANQPCPLNPTVPQEGFVFRLYDSTKKITFKAISNEYLLKYGL
jgi:hypothetical protein